MDQIIRPLEMAAAGQDKCRRIQVYPEELSRRTLPKNSKESRVRLFYEMFTVFSLPRR